MLCKYYTPVDFTAEQDTYDLLASYLPGFTNQSIQDILTLYPLAESRDNPAATHTKEFCRSTRLFKDGLMTSQHIDNTENLARLGNEGHFIDQNQTVLSPI